MSINPNQTNATPGTSLFAGPQASGLFSWPSANTTARADFTVPNVKVGSVITATVQVDDQTTPGACWLISATPTANTITFILAANATASSTLVISWQVSSF